MKAIMGQDIDLMLLLFPCILEQLCLGYQENLIIHNIWVFSTISKRAPCTHIWCGLNIYNPICKILVLSHLLSSKLQFFMMIKKWILHMWMEIQGREVWRGGQHTCSARDSYVQEAAVVDWWMTRRLKVRTLWCRWLMELNTQEGEWYDRHWSEEMMKLKIEWLCKKGMDFCSD